jgi:hypothetical protein
VNRPQTTPSRPELGPASRAAWTVVFAATVGLGAVLLFSVQLVLAKRLLPWFGGTSALWTTCQLFFQLALLGGYAWSHGLVRRASARRQRDLQLALLALALVQLSAGAWSWPSPVTPGDALRPLASDPPVRTVLRLLASAVGLPFVALAATSPLLSSWFARLLPRESQFWLFALSNLGALVGLLGYPLLVEPRSGLHAQGWLWSAGFVLFTAGVASCAIASAAAPAGAGARGAADADPAAPGAQRPA